MVPSPWNVAVVSPTMNKHLPLPGQKIVLSELRKVDRNRPCRRMPNLSTIAIFKPAPSTTQPTSAKRESPRADRPVCRLSVDPRHALGSWALGILDDVELDALTLRQ